MIISYSETSGDVASRSRQGRQQNGDTYTLEIAFPAVKYVHKKKTAKSRMFCKKLVPGGAMWLHCGDLLSILSSLLYFSADFIYSIYLFFIEAICMITVFFSHASNAHFISHSICKFYSFSHFVLILICNINWCTYVLLLLYYLLWLNVLFYRRNH